MRLSPDKVGRMSEQVVKALIDKKAIVLDRPGRAGQAALVAAIRDLILDDLRVEEEIDAEVERFLASYSRKIIGTERDIMFRKAKEEIAAKRGYIL
jgi:hypothetical protein